jgi:uncharacterized protein DUF3263
MDIMDIVDVDDLELIDEVDDRSEVDHPSDAPASALAGEFAAGEFAAGNGLTDRERQVLAFERQWWRHAGSKEQAVRDLFAVSSTRYYQMLNGLLDNPAALAYDPVLVKRLRRLRATRTRARSGGRVN